MTPSEIIPAVIAAAETVAATGSVVRDDGTVAVDQKIDAILGTSGQGIATVIDPIHGATVTDQLRRGAFGGKHLVRIWVTANLTNAPEGTTADTLFDYCQALLLALLTKLSPAAELAPAYLDFVPEDLGTLTYALSINVKSNT